MADTGQITYTDHDGNATVLFADNIEIEYVKDNLSITRTPGQNSVVTDPIQTYRVVSCSCDVSATTANTLDAQEMDTTKRAVPA